MCGHGDEMVQSHYFIQTYTVDNLTQLPKYELNGRCFINARKIKKENMFSHSSLTGIFFLEFFLIICYQLYKKVHMHAHKTH